MTGIFPEINLRIRSLDDLTKQGLVPEKFGKRSINWQAKLSVPVSSGRLNNKLAENLLAKRDPSQDLNNLCVESALGTI